MELFNKFLSGIEQALQYGAAVSIVLGVACAIFGTQYVKRLEVFPSNKWVIRGGLALPLGFVATFFTWPVHELNAVRFFMAVCVGLTAPVLYQGAVFFLYRKWPGLEAKMSAAPGNNSTT